MRGSIRAALTVACLAWGCGPGSAQRADEDTRELTRGTSAMYASQEDMPKGALGRYGSRAMRLRERPQDVSVNPTGGQIVALERGVAWVLEPSEREGVLRRWDARSRHGGLTWARFTSSGGHLIVGGARGRTLEVWSTKDRRRTLTIGTGASRKLVAATSPTEDLVAYQGRREVVFYDMEKREERARIRTGNTYGMSMAFSADGSTLVLLHSKGYMAWDVREETPKLISSYKRNLAGWSGAMALSEDGLEFAAANTRGRVEQWSVKDQKQVGYFDLADSRASQSAVTQLTWRKGKIWVAREDKWSRRVERWDAVTPGEQPEVWAPGERVVFDSMGGMLLARGSTLTTVRPEEFGAGARAPGHASAVRQLALGPDGALWSSGDDGALLRWSMESRSGEAVKIGESVVAPVFDMKDGTLALWRGLGEDEGLLEIWRGGARVSGLKLREQLARIDLDPETLEVTAADVHGSTYRYDMKEQVRTRRTPFGTRGGSRLLAASEGLEVVVVDDAPSGSRRTSSPSALRSWDVDTGKLKAKRRRPRGAILRCAAEAGGKTACVTSSSTIEVYEEGGPDDETLGTIPHALQRLTGLEFTPDGEHVMVIGRPLRAIASAHDTLRIVRVEDAALTHKIDLLPGRVTSVLSHPDGRRLFLGFEDGLIYEWDLDMFEVKSALNPEPTR